MNKYQKVLVRYELDERYKDSDDFYSKWVLPCYLCIKENEPTWYNATFDDIKKAGEVHTLVSFADPSERIPKDNCSDGATFTRMQAKRIFESDIHNVIDNLMNMGLVVRNENGRTYKYIFEGYRCEKLIIKEILGIEAETFQDLTDEQFNELESKLNEQWEVERKLFEEPEDYFVDFSSAFNK